MDESDHHNHTQENDVFQTQSHPSTTPPTPPARTLRVRATRRVLLPVAAIGLLALGAAPATARPDPGPALEVPAARTTALDAAPAGLRAATTEPQTRCTLQRVGTQYVACDYLTGNGVPAPGWIPKR